MEYLLDGGAQDKGRLEPRGPRCVPDVAFRDKMREFLIRVYEVEEGGVENPS